MTVARTIAQRRARHKAIDGEWVWVFQEPLQRLVMARTMTWQSWQVFLYLASCLTYGESIPLHQGHVAAALKMPRSNVSRALGLLEKLGLVQKHRSVTTGAAVYTLSSAIIYKGAGEQLPQRRAQQRRGKGQEQDG